MSVQPYYECHVTIKGDPKVEKDRVESIGWAFSAIDGDPLLGEGVKCYATKHFNKKFSQEFVAEWVAQASNALIMLGSHVLREKVELVLVDRRFN